MAQVQDGWRLARVMAVVAGVGAVLAPLATIIVWAVFDPALIATGLGFELTPDPDAGPVEEGAKLFSETARLAGAAVSVVATIPTVIALWNVRRTFLECAAGQPFSPRSVAAFRRFAWASFIGVFARLVQKPIAIAAVTGLSPSLQGQITVGIGSPDVAALFSALLLVTLAHVFAEGRKMADDVEGLL